MTEYIASLKGIQAQKRNEWLRKNVQSVRDSIETMTVSQCVQWQGTMSELPEFLTDNDLADITNLSLMITEKIKTQKINGILELYVALSAEERAECLRRLQGIL